MDKHFFKSVSLKNLIQVYAIRDFRKENFEGMSCLIGKVRMVCSEENLHFKFSKVFWLHILNDRFQFILLFQKIGGKKSHLFCRLNH